MPFVQDGMLVGTTYGVNNIFWFDLEDGSYHSFSDEYLGLLAPYKEGRVLALQVDYNAAECPRKMGTFSQYQYPHTMARYAECARFVGIQAKTDAEAVDKLVDKIEELKAAVGIKKSIAEYGVDEKYFMDTLDDMCEKAFDDQCTGATPDTR